MSIWDYVMPHRLLINRSLRRETEGLRARVDAYQIEYDRRVRECQEELERIEEGKRQSLDRLKRSFELELRNEKAILEAVSQDIMLYADSYLQRKCLYQIRDIKKKQINILQEDYEFLSEQMKMIGKEIDLLEDRKKELTAFTKVDDIIRLAAESGYELDFNMEDDARCLLDKVSNAMSSCTEDQKIERFALIRLKGIIQERSEYLPAIKYIEWVIPQKIRFSKHLAEKRKTVKKEKESAKQSLKPIRGEIDALTNTLEDTAERIRLFWAHPIAYLNADIAYAYHEKGETGSRLRDVGEELHNMARLHSDDQDKWERLQREREELSTEIESLKDSILIKKEERAQWSKKSKQIFELCRKYEIPLISDENHTDEKRIIRNRLSELGAIRAAGAAEAEALYAQECSELISTYEHCRAKMKSELSLLEAQLNALDSECSKSKAEVSSAERKLKELEDKDNRFILSKLFSENLDVVFARSELFAKNTVLSNLQEKKAAVEKQVIDTKSKISDLEEQHAKDLRSRRPRYLRPTAEESLEEMKLNLKAGNRETTQGGRP